MTANSPSAETPVNINRLTEMSDGDREFETELIEIFVEDVELHLGELDRALETIDTESCRKKAHTIKGASGNLGATELQNLAFSLERLGSSGDLDGAGELIAQIRGEFERVKTFLNDYLSNA